jgi:hypothetical protein
VNLASGFASLPDVKISKVLIVINRTRPHAEHTAKALQQVFARDARDNVAVANLDFPGGFMTITA